MYNIEDLNQSGNTTKSVKDKTYMQAIKGNKSISINNEATVTPVSSENSITVQKGNTLVLT